MDDLISRQAAIDEVKSHYRVDNDLLEVIAYKIGKLPTVQPKYNPDEWCHDCKEYNHDKHCCPRYNKVIRNAVEEMKQPKIGHWIHTSGYNWHCSECDFIQHESKTEYKYCPNCGAKMVEPQERSDKE